MLHISCKPSGCSIEIPINRIDDILPEFMLKQRLSGKLRYTTETLMGYEEQIKLLKSKIDEIKEKTLQDIKRRTKELVQHVREYSERISYIDLLHSIYTISKQENMNRPELAREGSLEIKGGIHLTAKKVLNEYDPLSFRIKNSKPLILTGANGSGKSTLLKEIAIIVIMAQAGFFVPAEYAKIPLFDRLFTVLNVSDEIINKKSSHQAQMKEISETLLNLTNRSLVLFDEIGKNTSYKEGVSILYGLLKHISETYDTKLVVSTHYTVLKDLLTDIKCDFSKIVFNGRKREIHKGRRTQGNARMDLPG